MWIEELANGKFKYNERYEDPLSGKQRKVSLTHSKNNKRVEKEMLLNLQGKINKKLTAISPDSQMTLEELGLKWLSFYKDGGVKLASYVRARSNINSLNQVLGDVQVVRLQSNHINQYLLNGLKSNQFKHSTANQIKSNISRALKYAQTYHGIKTKHIVDALEVPKINISEKNEYNYLEPHELSKVVEYYSNTNGHEQKRMVLLQATTGMRFGEMASLDYKKDIDFSASSISINKTFDYRNNIFTSPKTGDKRIIYFSDEIAKLLREQIHYTQQLTMRRRLPRENTNLFKSMHGNVVLHRVINDSLPEVGLDKKVTTHTLRHTFVSLAVEKGINKELIAKQVGHSDTKMIDEIYAHFTDGMQRQQKEAMLDFKII